MIVSFVLLIFALAVFPLTEMVDDCEGEWDESIIESSDDIGESV